MAGSQASWWDRRSLVEEQERRRGEGKSGAERKRCKAAAKAAAEAVPKASGSRLQATAKVRPDAPGRAESSDSSGVAPQARPLLLFPGAEEESCEYCLQPFSTALPFAPYKRGVGSGTSGARADLRLCSGCVPVVQLAERLQRGSTEVTCFVQVAAALLKLPAH